MPSEAMLIEPSPAKQCDKLLSQPSWALTGEFKHTNDETSNQTNNQPIKLAVKQSNKQVLFFVDWDDTLLASTALNNFGIRLDTDLSNDQSNFSTIKQSLNQLDQSIVQFLNKAVQITQLVNQSIDHTVNQSVYIITNAEKNWVEFSAKKFLPLTYQLLTQSTSQTNSQSPIKIISARSTYERSFPDSPVRWKYQAFNQVIHQVINQNSQSVDQSVHQSNSEIHVLSFGDSYVEREAIRSVVKSINQTIHQTINQKYHRVLYKTNSPPIHQSFTQSVSQTIKCKSVKFTERPSIDELTKQIDCLLDCSLDCLVDYADDLDLQLTVTINPSEFDKSVTQPVDQSVTQTTEQTIQHKIDMDFHSTVKPSTYHSVTHRTITHGPAKPAVSQKVTESLSQTINRSISQVISSIPYHYTDDLDDTDCGEFGAEHEEDNRSFYSLIV